MWASNLFVEVLMRYPTPRCPQEDISSLGLIEHDIAAHLPPDTTAIFASGDMDNHRKPIMSINGKDVPEHDEHLGKS
ncbi:MAG: hypothetical protein ABI383_02430 [Acidobacteriaceae bacterium]